MDSEELRLKSIALADELITLVEKSNISVAHVALTKVLGFLFFSLRESKRPEQLKACHEFTAKVLSDTLIGKAKFPRGV